MRRKTSSYIRNKWNKTRALLKYGKLRPYIPETRNWSRHALREMLVASGMVYVKPVNGMHGIGVMRVEKANDASKTSYRYQQGTRRKTFHTFGSLYRSLQRAIRNEPYLVQEGIDLLTYKNRRFDLRVMVQKNREGTWEATGIIGRVAHPRYVVTNYHSHGKLASADTLMQEAFHPREKKRFIHMLMQLSLKSAHALEQRYPAVKEIGVDIGIDSKRQPWIIEINTWPDPFIFKTLKDKRIYRKIYEYAKMHGRIPASRK